MQTLRIKKPADPLQALSKVSVPAFSIVLTVCSFLCLLVVFDLPCSFFVITVFSVLLPAVLFWLMSKASKYIYMLLPLLIAVYFAAAYQVVWKGYLTIANCVITKIDRYYHLGILTYDTGAAFDRNLYATMALIPAILLFSYLTVVSVRHRLFVPVILLSLPFILAGVSFHVYSVMPAAVLIVIIWSVLFSSSMSQKFSWKTAVWLFSIAALVGILIYFVFPYSKFISSQPINSIRRSAINEIDDLRYNYGIKKVPMDLLPNGDLKDAKTLSYTDEVVMNVKMQKPSAVYLKGYVGSVYSNNRWNSLPAAAYSGNYTGLFEWLAKNKFYPQSQISGLCSISPQLSSSGITVNNIALKSKYIYAPYEAVPTKDLLPQKVDYGQDTGIFSTGLFGTRSYSFSMVSPITADYGTADLNQWVKENIGDNANYSQYVKDEMAYRAFVYKNYLDVPGETKKAIDTYFTKTTMDFLKNKSTQSVIDFLRRYYLQKLSFSTEIKPLPANSDFISNFLKTGTGYDVHFATLSVMVLRSAGIPARYVEGYYLPHSYVDIYSKTENATLEIKDSFAHAWVEIYADGIGWIPAELTPGYYNAAKDPTKKTGSDEKVSKKDKNLYNDQDSAVTNDSADKQSQAKKNANQKTISVIIAAILTALIAAFWLHSKRKKNFAQHYKSQPHKGKAALKIYAYASRLIQFDGIKINRYSAYESSDEISQKYDRNTGMKFKDFLRLVYKARFGPTEPSMQEFSDMQCYVKSLAKQIYERQGFAKRVLLKLSGLV